MAKAMDLTGIVFGRLTVIARDFERQKRCPHRFVHWTCKCECGKVTSVNAGNLRRGGTTSCGCYLTEKLTKHGHTKWVNGRGRKTPEYTAWCELKKRCLDHERYPAYGGRGITYCERWESFENFLADMGKRPSRRHSLDRIDVNGNYEPDNCRWATSSMQGYNQRLRSTNTSGYRGVNLNRTKTKWVASITVNYRSIVLGYFVNKEDAIAARAAAERKYIGKRP